MHTFIYTKEINASTEQVYAFAIGVNIPLKKQVEVDETYTEEEVNEQGETVTVEKIRKITNVINKTEEEVVADVQEFFNTQTNEFIRSKFRVVLMKNAQVQVEQALDSLMQ